MTNQQKLTVLNSLKHVQRDVLAKAAAQLLVVNSSNIDAGPPPFPLRMISYK